MLMLSLLLSLLSGCLALSNNVTVLTDIRRAFGAVTNDSALLDHIIPEMYGPIMRVANPTFVFKMPTQPDSDSFELLTMQRSDFAEPIFPNITEVVDKLAEQPPLATAEQHVKISLVEAPPQEWQQLGLEGWKGELASPLPWLEQSHKDIQPSDWQAAYPRDQILLDLKNQHFDGRVKDIRVISSNDGQPAELQDLKNVENVYIARVNDPFGYSMKWTLSNISSTSSNDSSGQVPMEQRGKRDVTRLYSMIKCSTGCDPLIYKGYGCYCGLGGHGVPADGIDRCCRLHDKCYTQSNCISYLEYFVPYVWKCYNGKPLCAIDHGEWGGPDSCAARLCQCDLRLSRCLRKFHCPARRAVCYSSRARRLQNLIYFN